MDVFMACEVAMLPCSCTATDGSVMAGAVGGGERWLVVGSDGYW